MRAGWIGRQRPIASIRRLVRSHVHSPAQLLDARDAGVDLANVEVGHPARRRIAKALVHFDHATVVAAPIADVDVMRIAIEFPAQQLAVEGFRRRRVAREQLIPAHGAFRVDDARADVVARLPQAQSRAGRVHQESHATAVKDIHRSKDDLAAIRRDDWQQRIDIVNGNIT